MAGVQMRIRVDLNGVDRAMYDRAKAIDNFKTPLRNSGTYMETSVARRFRNQGGSEGAWKPLSPATISRHPHRAGGRILSDTGALRSSVTSGAKQRVSGKRLYYGFGTGIIYGATHQFGRGNIPARPFLYFDDKDERMIKRIFEDYIKGVIERG